MAIFYMKVNIIGRSSGRSAIGAAAYRRSAKMQSVAHAAYQRGEKIYEKGDKITHDYRSKGGVVHSEIILPEGAPPEFMDAQTLWNAVEKSEKRKDAQLAREIIVALPKEFNLEESVEVFRAYLRENFVKIGMVADFSIHDKGDGNPHAHIMLTTRNVTPDGFGKKNTDWNKKELLLEWRKAWANIINSTFERKGLAERIDHRSYKEQGIDRLPFVHMGHVATALERQGVRTEKGDYNREIQRRNIERAALLEEAKILEHQAIMQGMMELQKATMQGMREMQQQQHETIIQVVRELRQHQQAAKPLERAESAAGNANATAESVPNETRTTLTTAKRMSEPHEAHVALDVKSLIPKENHVRKPNVIKMAKHREKISRKYNSAKWDLNFLKSSRNVVDSENFYMNLEIEDIDEAVKNIQTLTASVPQLEAEHQRLASRWHFWNRKRKKELEEAIRQAKKDNWHAQHSFVKFYNAAPEEAPTKIARIQKKIETNEPKIVEIDREITKAEKKLQDIKQEYDQYRLEHKINVRRKLKKQPDPTAELSQAIDRPSVRKQLKEIRKPEQEIKRRKEALEKLRAIKPIRFLIIDSPEQKKRSLADVLGKYYRKINGRVYPSVPLKKEKSVG